MEKQKLAKEVERTVERGRILPVYDFYTFDGVKVRKHELYLGLKTKLYSTEIIRYFTELDGVPKMVYAKEVKGNDTELRLNTPIEIVKERNPGILAALIRLVIGIDYDYASVYVLNESHTV